MTNKPHLERLAEHRHCSYEQARQMCFEVQRLQSRTTSFSTIAEAALTLPSDANIEAIVLRTGVTCQATTKRKSRPDRPIRGARRRRLPHSSSPPRYIIVDGVVETTKSWRESEGMGSAE